MFKRPRPEQHGPANPDPSLPLLSVPEATLLAQLAQRALAEHGLETLYDGAGCLIGADGTRFGLSNLSAIAAKTPHQGWRQLVTGHAKAMATAGGVVEPRSLDEARDLLMLKLCAADQISADCQTYGAEVLPGLVVLAAIDYPTHVSNLTREDALEQLGGWAAVAPVGLANLRRLPRPEHLATQAGPGPDSTVHVFHTEDFYGASRFLLIDELLTSTLLVERPAHGVLVAVPNRHVLAVHVVSGIGLLDAMRAMVQLTAAQYDTAPGSLSPYVFYRAADGRTQQVSRTGEDGQTRVDVVGLFEEAWLSVGLLEED